MNRKPRAGLPTRTLRPFERKKVLVGAWLPRELANRLYVHCEGIRGQLSSVVSQAVEQYLASTNGR